MNPLKMKTHLRTVPPAVLLSGAAGALALAAVFARCQMLLSMSVTAGTSGLALWTLLRTLVRKRLPQPPERKD
jgi:hypothetical protein